MTNQTVVTFFLITAWILNYRLIVWWIVGVGILKMERFEIVVLSQLDAYLEF